MAPRAPRRLAPAFLDDVATGLLAPARDRVLGDRSLCLDLRVNNVNVYSRLSGRRQVARLEFVPPSSRCRWS